MYFTVSVSENIRYTIPEEMEIGAFIGNISKDADINVKHLFTRKFRISSETKKQYLDVNLNTGKLYIKEKIDREELCDRSLPCVLKMEGLIENPLKLYHLEITILDVNDNSPVFQKGKVNIEISEVTPVGATFPLPVAQDADAGSNSVQSYKLSPSEHFTLKLQSDGEQTDIPELILEQPLDREQRTAHRLTLTAFDGGNPRKFGTAQIIITVLDANDNAPVCEKSIYQITTHENVPKDTLIVKVTANDLDEGLNGEVTYSFSDHTPDRVRELFSLNATSGEIRVIGVVDFEEAENYQILVQVKDRGTAQVPVYCKVLLKITDVNDNSPQITTTSTSSIISEHALPDTAVAFFKVTDRDSGNEAAVYCRIAAGTPFKLRNSSNDYYTLVTAGDLDREKMSDYNITIVCTDRGSPPLLAKKTIRVFVSDINDNAPHFTQSSFTLHVKENNVIGDSIGTVRAFDPDYDENAQLSYSILNVVVHSLSVSSLVSINPASGVLVARRSFDFEEIKSFQFLVHVRDAGSPPLSSNVTVNVIIVDQNDNAPVIVSPLPNKGAAVEETIPRSADSGYLVTKVTATDADSGLNAQLSYHLSQPSDGSLFTLATETGELWTIRRFLHKDPSRQKIVIVVRDNGTPSLSSTVTINVSVQDDRTENGSNIGMLGTSVPWKYDLKFYLMIGFGATSLLLLLAIVVLGIKVHKARKDTSSYCCCWNMFFPSRDSTIGIQKASVNIQLPPNYKEMYDNETLRQPFHRDPGEELMTDFMLLKLRGVPAPMINIKTGSCARREHGKISKSTSRNITEFHEICGNRQWDLEQSSMEGCPSGQNTLAKNQVEPEQRSFLEIHSHAL
ncbi:protocadherin-10-like isoform X2 [Pristis pectinata]|uniref:protocadherin-10-like isoform X2 n=1 Tax=Pristis pectinata TaxID=685728 RepID=UPI00223D2879|nr:protocadherin-10-like isoform X2 [Pristis pectinata]